MTASDDPSLMPVTKMKPYSISMMTSLTRPPPKGAAAPWARPMRPLAAAANRSAASRLNPPDFAISKPSAETTIASRTPGTWSAKFPTRKLMLTASELSWLIVPSLLGVPLGGGLLTGGRLVAVTTGGETAPVARQDAADLLRRTPGRRDQLVADELLGRGDLPRCPLGQPELVQLATGLCRR